MARTTLTIGGMSCGHCVKAVEAALRGVEGVEVESVEVGRARMRFDPAAVTPERLAAVVEEEGYEVLGWEGEGEG